MLIVCNGAFKSGSTWVYELVNAVLTIKNCEINSVPEKYSPGRSPAVKISEDQLLDFIKNEELSSKLYVTKSHYFKEETLQIKYPEDVKFIFIERDLRDAVVSHYHHILIYSKFKISFNIYYKIIGKYKAFEIKLFNDRCKKHFGIDNFLIYEEIKKDTGNAINEICDIIEIGRLSNEECKKVIEQTSLQALRSRAKKGDTTHYHGAGADNAKLFRKGKVGEYESYFSSKNLTDINRIKEGRFGIGALLWYKLFFVFRRRIFKI